MYQQYHKEYSPILNRNMKFKVYGHAGKPCIAFPCQSGSYYDYETFGMIERLKPWLDAGKLRIFSVDSIDSESWANFDGDLRYRAEMQEKYYRYITEEFVPRIWNYCEKQQPVMVTGNSMGAFHAAICFFRRPDLFDTIIGLSGPYTSTGFFGDYMDDIVYNNSPVHFLRNMPSDHYYLDMYRQRKIIIAIGQGAWEDSLLPSNRELDTILAEKGVPAWFDYWGFDMNHDWPTWHKMIVYFMENVLPL